MTEKEMRLELEENSVQDNPFDVMLHFSMDLTRELLFACHRMKNSEIAKCVQTNPEILKKKFDMIMNEFGKLQNMSEETVAMCRETSYYYEGKKFNEMNKALLTLDNNMETIWSRSVPNRNDQYERIRLGEDSDEYKRILELRNIIDTAEEFSNIDRDYLYELLDVIDKSDGIPDEFIDERYKEDVEIIRKYKLTIEDVMYMTSYKFSKS